MKDERHETIEQSVTDCNHLGNAAKMRKALVMAQRVLHCAIVAEILKGDDAQEALNVVTAALSAPPRNCDIGTPDEHLVRHRKWCWEHDCKPTDSCKLCVARWAQMPYEEGKDDEHHRID